MILHLLQAALLGIIQGITEFLPVSSTAHLIIFQNLFGLDQQTYGLSFDMATTLGTTLALVWYFRSDLWKLLRGIRLPHRDMSTEERMPWWIIGTTIIVGIAGLLLEEKVATVFRSLELIAVTLTLFSGVMLLAEWLYSRPRQPLDGGRAYGMGIAQILAFIPGVSRSGATISTGLILGLDRTTAARFSFLLSVPITLAATLKRLATAVHEFQLTPPSGEVIAFYVVGFVVAGVVGYFSLQFLLNYLKKSSLVPFAVYRLLLAAAIGIYLVVR